MSAPICLALLDLLLANRLTSSHCRPLLSWIFRFDQFRSVYAAIRFRTKCSWSSSVEHLQCLFPAKDSITTQKLYYFYVPFPFPPKTFWLNSWTSGISQFAKSTATHLILTKFVRMMMMMYAWYYISEANFLNVFNHDYLLKLFLCGRSLNLTLYLNHVFLIEHFLHSLSLFVLTFGGFWGPFLCCCSAFPPPSWSCFRATGVTGVQQIIKPPFIFNNYLHTT